MLQFLEGGEATHWGIIKVKTQTLLPVNALRDKVANQALINKTYETEVMNRHFRLCKLEMMHSIDFGIVSQSIPLDRQRSCRNILQILRTNITRVTYEGKLTVNQSDCVLKYFSKEEACETLRDKNVHLYLAGDSLTRGLYFALSDILTDNIKNGAFSETYRNQTNFTSICVEGHCNCECNQQFDHQHCSQVEMTQVDANRMCGGMAGGLLFETVRHVTDYQTVNLTSKLMKHIQALTFKEPFPRTHTIFVVISFGVHENFQAFPQQEALLNDLIQQVHTYKSKNTKLVLMLTSFPPRNDANIPSAYAQSQNRAAIQAFNEKMYQYTVRVKAKASAYLEVVYFERFRIHNNSKMHVDTIHFLLQSNWDAAQLLLNYIENVLIDEVNLQNYDNF